MAKRNNRQQKKIDKLQAEEKSISNRLNNENFVKNAKPEVVEETRVKAEELQKQILTVKALIDSLS